MASAVTSKRYTVEFTEAPEKGPLEKALTFCTDLLSRISLQSLSNAWYIGRRNDSSQPFLWSWIPGSFILDFPTPGGTLYLTANTHIVKQVLKSFRKEAEGIFYDHEGTRLFVEGILKDLYPEALAEIGLEKAVENLVISASSIHVKGLRAPITKTLGSQSVIDNRATLDAIANEILDSLSEEERDNCDASQLSFRYAVMAISKLFTNYDTTTENYLKLVKALDALSKQMTRIVSHRPATAIEQIEYQEGLADMRAAIDNIMSSDCEFVNGLRQNGWNDFQIRSNLFFLYFGGTETTASSMNYLLWQLGREENLSIQTEIQNPESGEKILEKSIAETLRLHPPSFIQGRQFRKDTLVTVTERDGESSKTLFQKELRQGHSILCLNQAAGLDSTIYPEPNKFNPHRHIHESDKLRFSQLSFLPFGDGPHTCPGQYLAVEELKSFVSQLLKRFSIQTLSPEETEQKGFFTLRATAARIKLTALSEQ